MVFTSSPRRVRKSLVAALVALVAGSACVQDQDFLIVERALWFGDRDDCTLGGSQETPLALAVDVSFDTRIGMGFLVTNNQSPNPGSNTGLDDSEVIIESAEVNLAFSGGAVAGGSFEVTLPSNSLGGGQSEAFLIQVPTEVSQSLRGGMTPGQFETLEMEVVFKGRKYGQAGNSKLGEIQSRAYTFPFELCHGCLADCSVCGVCPSTNEWVGTCGFAQGLPIYHPSCDAEDGG
ncbi:MAG: hypothetical protein R6X02_13740 [Enhygromyxa sp.]